MLTKYIDEKTHDAFTSLLVSGSRLATTLAHASVPFNKNYAQLNATQKSEFRKGFSSLSFKQTPPFPQCSLQAIYRPIANLSLSMDVQGKFDATVTVNRNGIVENVTIHENPNSALSVKASKLLQNTQFQAATCESQTCDMNFPVAYPLFNWMIAFFDEGLLL